MRALVWAAGGPRRLWCDHSLPTHTSQRPHAASRTSCCDRAAEQRAMPHARGASGARHRQHSRWWRWQAGSRTARAAVAALPHALHGGNAVAIPGTCIHTGHVMAAAFPPSPHRCRSGQRNTAVGGLPCMPPQGASPACSRHPRIIAPPRQCHAMTASQRPRREPQQAAAGGSRRAGRCSRWWRARSSTAGQRHPPLRRQLSASHGSHARSGMAIAAACCTQRHICRWGRQGLQRQCGVREFALMHPRINNNALRFNP